MTSTTDFFRKHWKGYAFLIPIFLVLGTFKYIPFFNAVKMSFYNWNGANVKEFIGLDNFVRLFHDETLHAAMVNIGVFTLSGIIIQLTLPLIAAVLVFHVTSAKLQNALKVWFVIPLVIPSIVIFLTWQWIYAGEYGVLNQFLELIGLDSWTHAWLGESKTAIWSIIFVNFPWIGGINFLIYLAGLMSISGELFEVAKLDGMNPWQRFMRLELPLVRSQIKLIMVLTIIGQIQSFENVLVLTNGGPGDTTLTPALYLYTTGFSYNEMGYSSAIGLSLFIILLLLTLINNKFIKNTEKID
ncbi:carbohydrate ABC transporter permease [Paenibacillus eucommiae]|uniref:Raffinose/stachyose/melibiose transport system permease protein n=1 Tax=Paenibacillus eucommiae TaxID=1355755 RepID=A0ABS4IWL5_9BACL|nr:sugar ABC transporter permease [Paenibacillus eucommiae]MBP1991983.1 raffinose/stachyose/melibiose transport system permease protein [Paenibacillus eucommiae]